MRAIEAEGLDAAARDFLAGMTDRYAVNLYEQLFIPKPWVSLTELSRVGSRRSCSRRGLSPSPAGTVSHVDCATDKA